MRELRSEEIGDRRVALIATEAQSYGVTIEVRGAEGTWEDITHLHQAYSSVVVRANKS